MSTVSQKCQYALRALLELAKHEESNSVVKIAEIAEAQDIPVRFLEAILAQLKQGGFVASRRGVDGGYQLLRAAEALTAGEIIRFIEGPIGPVECVAGQGGEDCKLHGRCAFMGMWRRARDVVAGVYDSTTFRDLVDADRVANESANPNYCI